MAVNGNNRVLTNNAVHRNAPFHSGVDITTSAGGPVGVFAVDMYNDGDLDILSASYDNNTIAWYKNEGGSVVFTHNGIAADRNLELNYWNLDLLESICSTPLNSDQVNANLAALRVRLDDGNGVFEAYGSDVQVGIVSSGSFTLDGSVTQ